MTINEKPSLEDLEAQIKEITSNKHQKELGLINDILNMYIDGFKSIKPFKYTKENVVETTWLLLLVRSFHSMRCAMPLIQTAYYGQAISLLRTITENYFVCHDCINNRKTVEAILYNKYRIPDSNQGLSFRQMAIRTGNLKIYKGDYDHQSRVNHPTALSLGMLRDPQTNTINAAPSYDRILFLDCCEQFFRNALMMAEIMGWLLSNIAKTSVTSWGEKANNTCKKAADWLKAIREKYGEEHA